MIEISGWYPEDFPSQKVRWTVIDRQLGPKVVHLKTFDSWFEAEEYAALLRTTIAKAEGK